MTLNSEFYIVKRHARTIIRYDDFVNTAPFKRNADFAGTRIKRIFNQFLERACRPFDNFTCGNLINEPIWQLPDTGHHHLAT